MKILITGGCGFIGTNLQKLLNKKYDIKIIEYKKGGNKNIFVGDLKDYNQIEKYFKGIDVVIHLAFSKNYDENIIIAQNVIKASRKNKIKKIIVMSSMSAKRAHPDEYGLVKRKIEKITEHSGLVYTILRPSIIYGPGSRSFDFIIDKINSVPLFTPIIGSGKYYLAPVYIQDIARAVESCIKNKETNNKNYDLPGGEKIYFIDLVNLLKKEINSNKLNIKVPIWACNLIATIFPRLISRENIKNITGDSLANPDQAKKDFGYNPIKLKGGIKNGLI